MEMTANLHVEKLPEGAYLATSDDFPSLVAQGRTISETVEIARDVAEKLLEVQAASGSPCPPCPSPPASSSIKTTSPLTLM